MCLSFCFLGSPVFNIMLSWLENLCWKLKHHNEPQSSHSMLDLELKEFLGSILSFFMTAAMRFHSIDVFNMTIELLNSNVEAIYAEDSAFFDSYAEDQISFDLYVVQWQNTYLLVLFASSSLFFISYWHLCLWWWSRIFFSLCLFCFFFFFCGLAFDQTLSSCTNFTVSFISCQQ